MGACAVAMLNLGPCSMLPPHYHPRASNYVVAVQGTTQTYMIEENGARVVQQTLTPGKMTIFPQASVHTMVNLGEHKLFACPLSLCGCLQVALACRTCDGSVAQLRSLFLLSINGPAAHQTAGVISSPHMQCTFVLHCNLRIWLIPSRAWLTRPCHLPECTNAQLVSALNNEDAGTQNIIAALFHIPNPDLVNAAFGYQNVITNSSGSFIPAVGTGSNYGTKECLARCAARNGTYT